MQAQQRKNWIYWTSPIWGALIPTIIFFLAQGYYALPQNEGKDSFIYFTSTPLYLQLLVLGIAGIYAYLVYLRKFPQHYTSSTLASLALTAAVIVVVGKARFCVGMEELDCLSFLAGYLLWVSLYYIPSYWMAHERHRITPDDDSTEELPEDSISL